MKYFSIPLAAVLLSASILSAQNTISIPDLTASPGDSNVALSVELSNPSQAVSGIQFTLHFDTSIVQFVDVTAGSQLSSTFSVSSSSGGDSVNVIVVSLSGDSITPGNREVIEFHFNISSSASNGDSTTLSLSNVVLASPQGNHLPVSAQDGVLRISVVPRAFLLAGSDIVAPGDTAEIQFNLENPSDVVAGIQFTVAFDGSVVEYSSMTQLLPSQFSCSANGFTDSVKVICVSLSGDSLTAGAHDIVSMAFDIDSSATRGDSLPLAVENVVIVDPSAQRIPSDGADGFIGIKPDVPSIVSPANGSLLNSLSVALVWHEADGAAQYSAWLSTSPDFSTIVDSATVSDTTCTLTATADTTYYLQVRAISGRGYLSDWSAPVTVEIDATPPNTPSLIEPIGGNWSQSQAVQLRWTSVSLKATPVHYVVEVMRGASAVVHDTVDTNILIVNLSDGRYQWHVMSFDEAGNSSSWSPSDSFGVDTTPPTMPSLISPPESAMVSANSLTFVWSSASDSTSGIMEYSLSLGDSVWNTPDTSITVSLNGFQDTTYSWHVEVFDHAENFTVTGNRTLIIDRTAPSAPTLIEPVGDIWLSNSEVQLRWTQVSLKATPIHYIVEVVRHTSTVVYDTVDTNILTVNLPNARFRWHVMAFDEAGNASGWSPIARFGVDTSSPQIDSVTQLPDTTLFLGPFEVRAWAIDTMSGMAFVYLFWSVDGSPFDSVRTTGTSHGWVGEIPQLPDSANHTVAYFVVASDAAIPPNTAVSETLSFSFTDIEEETPVPKKLTLSMENHLSKGKLTLYLSLPADCDVDFALFNASGRVVKRFSRHLNRGNNRIEMDIREPYGVYFLRVRSAYGTAQTKILIAR